MAELKKTVAVVTGASSGIGEAVVRALAGSGARVMMAARRADRLARIAQELGGDAATCVTDVTDRSQVAALAESTIEKFGRVDVLVNNAGVMPLSFLAHRKVDEWDRMIDVNIKGVLYGIDAVLGHMLERGSGQIINVASVAGHRVSPSAAVYSGTKYAVRAISEGLRQETAGVLRVTIISPGAVATELTDSITDQAVRSFVGGFSEIAIDPAAIARAVVYAIEQPEEVSVNEIIVRPTKQKQ